MSGVRNRKRVLISELRLLTSDLLHFNFNINARWQRQTHQGIDCFTGRFQNINQSLVYAHFVLLPCIFVHERRTIHGDTFLFNRQWNWAHHFGTRAGGRIEDCPGGLVDNLVIVRANLNTNSLTTIIIAAFRLASGGNLWSRWIGCTMSFGLGTGHTGKVQSTK